MVKLSEPARITRLDLPERADLIGMSVRDGERELEALPAPGPLVDLTYADTKRFPPPPGVIERFLKAAQCTGMTYTPYRGDAGVLEAVAGNVGAFLGVDLNPTEDVLLAPGTQSALFCALSAIVEEGDRALLFDPDYLSSERMLRHLGAEVVHIPLKWTADVPGPDFDVLGQALRDEPRLLLFSHPNNPTGAVFPRSILEQIGAKVRGTEDTFVIVDELYARLIFEGGVLDHFIALEDMRERTVTLVGPSKSESMSGFRLGAAVAAPAVINRMEDVLSLTGLRAPAYAQHMLVGWMADDQDYMAQRIAEYRPLRDHAVERFNSSSALEVAKPGGTAYMFPRVLGDVPDQVVARRLKTEAGLVINPGYQSGPRGVGHFRVCFAQREDVWEQAVDDIIKIVEDAVGRD